MNSSTEKQQNLRLSWQERLALTADEGSFTEFDAALSSRNPISAAGSGLYVA